MSLPEPDSPELRSLVQNKVSRQIYKVLFEHQDEPLDIHEIREIARAEGEQEHFNRRLRTLYGYFVVERKRIDGSFTYRLAGKKDIPAVAAGSINKTLRASVLRDQRCAQCGRTPTEDGVKLHVDHKIPQSWGGTNDADNLQALCSECNEGKRDYFASLGDEVAEEILNAATYDEPHRRIGEALIAAYPNKIRSDVLERIASTKQYQEDWQKRLRELRVLGWKISTQRKKEQGRTMTYYFLQDLPSPLPEGNIRAEIHRIEKAKRKH